MVSLKYINLDISSKYNKCTYHVENYSDIDPSWFKDKKHTGITGGASTPHKDIMDVKKYIESL